MAAVRIEAGASFNSAGGLTVRIEARAVFAGGLAVSAKAVGIDAATLFLPEKTQEPREPLQQFRSSLGKESKGEREGRAPQVGRRDSRGHQSGPDQEDDDLSPEGGRVHDRSPLPEAFRARPPWLPGRPWKGIVPDQRVDSSIRNCNMGWVTEEDISMSERWEDRWAPEDLGLAVYILRGRRRWSQRRLEKEAGLAKGQASRYESGGELLSRRTLEKIAAAVGVRRFDRVERYLLPLMRPLREALEDLVRDEGSLVELEGGIWRASLAFARILRAGAAQLLDASETKEVKPLAALWEDLLAVPRESRRPFVERREDFWRSDLCQLLCEESIRAAADKADQAAEWAELAVLIAERVPGEKALRQRLEGFALGHLGSARRVQGQLSASREVFAQALPLWDAGAKADPGILNAARFLGLQASLHRAERRLPKSLALLDEALAIDHWGERGYLLLNKSRILEVQGDYESALAAASEAETLLEEVCEPRQVWGCKFNKITNLCFLERYAEAETLLPEVQRLSEELNNDLDRVRLRWLEGRVDAGLGQAEEALEMLGEVRESFLARNNAYDAALVTMEMAVLHLEAGRTEEVKRLAREMAPIFDAQEVHREALAALLLFRKAVEQDAATVALARRVVAYLYRARHDPELRFEEFAG